MKKLSLSEKQPPTWIARVQIAIIPLCLLILLLSGCNSSADDPPMASVTDSVTDSATDEVAPLSPEMSLPQWSFDPSQVIYRASVEHGAITEWTTTPLTPDAFSNAPIAPKQGSSDLSSSHLPSQMEKIQPALQRQIAGAPADQRSVLVITFQDDLLLPKFPEPLAHEARDTENNRLAFSNAASMIEILRQTRAPVYERLSQELVEGYQAEVLQRFWLINGLVVEMPLAAVAALAEREDVRYIEIDQSGEQPPPAHASEAEGQTWPESAPRLESNLFKSWIGLLDTGVRTSHTQFNDPNRLGVAFDCTVQGCTPVDTFTGDCYDHGTSSAAILVGNANLGEQQQGMTTTQLDSYNVYAADCSGLSVAASVFGFEEAVAMLDRVIVASIQNNSGPAGAIATAATHAVDTGAVVVAPWGYRAEGDAEGNAAVTSPANADAILSASSSVTLETQTQAATAEAREQPALRVPVTLETAASASDNATQLFGENSASAAYAGGAATLLRDWLRLDSSSIDPGQVNVWMILAGNNAASFDPSGGTGPLQLPTQGQAWWGKVTLEHGMTVDIPLEGGPAALGQLAGALWWAKADTQVQNDIDLYLIAPDNTVQASSASVFTSFEIAHVADGLSQGLWKLRIQAYAIGSGSQPVYWAAYQRE